MDRRDLSPLRALPRVFLAGVEPEIGTPIELPKAEVEKFRKVLRLAEGAAIAVLPNDGSVVRCEFRAKQAWPVSIERPATEPSTKIVLAQAFPKGDRLETVLRMGTELGVSTFCLFPAERSVVRWDAAKLVERKRRFDAIIREAGEQSFRTLLPEIVFVANLAEVFARWPMAIALSEQEGLPSSLADIPRASELTLVIGPEGGWAPREIELIDTRSVTMGPLVLRTDTAGLAAVAAILIGRRE